MQNGGLLANEVDGFIRPAEETAKMRSERPGASSTGVGAKGSLDVRAYKGKPFYEARWRDLNGRQHRRRLGIAWVELDGDGHWVARRGRARDGCLDIRSAYLAMAQVIDSHEAELQLNPPTARDVRFGEVAAAWLVYLKTEKRVKPSTLAAYRSLLAKPSGKPRQRGARIMRAFEGKRLLAIKTRDVRAFLASMDREDVSARTVNMHRQVLHSIFEFARREESFGAPSNPVADTSKRPEDGAKPIETFEPEEVAAVAEAAAAGVHRRRPGYPQSVYSAETEHEWQRINEQDASLFVIAATTGLRLGELIALRWSDIDLGNGIITVSRAMSAGQETSTKSRRSRVVPLADQARQGLEQLRKRDHFKSRGDLVFCRPDGGPLDPSAIRTRFIRAQKKAGVRVRRFHDLRHTFGSLAIRRFDVVAVKEMMGHAKLSTTERYLHSKPRPTDAAKLTAIFSERPQG